MKRRLAKLTWQELAELMRKNRGKLPTPEKKRVGRPPDPDPPGFRRRMPWPKSYFKVEVQYRSSLAPVIYELKKYGTPTKTFEEGIKGA